MAKLNVNAYIDQFEKQGATLVNPVLTEGNYKGNITALTARTNAFEYKTGKNKGKPGCMSSWGVTIALDSVTAAGIMGRDGDVLVFADRDTTCLRQAQLNVGEIGLTFDNNIGLWSFLGSIFEPVGLATKQQDDSGAAVYTFDPTIIQGIYDGTEEEWDKIEQGERLHEDDEINLQLQRGKLAEFQMKNISELVCSEADTRKVYVSIARREHYKNKGEKQHHVKNIMLPAAFEEVEGNIESIIE
jgi:hypothetical protein